MTYKVVTVWLPSFAVTMQELAETFSARVQDAIDDGYAPLGGVETQLFNGNLHLLQAMIKDKPNEIHIIPSSLNGEAGQKAEVRATGTGSGGTKGVDTSENAGSPLDGVCGSGVGPEKQSPHTPASSAEMRRNERHSGSRKTR